MSKAARRIRAKPSKRIQWTHLEITALHEAAHAVVATEVGVEVVRVELTFEDENENNTFVGGWCDCPEPAAVPMEVDERTGEERVHHLYCFARVIYALAGKALEEELRGKAAENDVDDRIVTGWIDSLKFSPEDEIYARTCLAKAAATTVKECLPKITAFASVLLGRVDQALKEGPHSGVWSVAIEGADLRQCLAGRGI